MDDYPDPYAVTGCPMCERLILERHLIAHLRDDHGVSQLSLEGTDA